MDPLLSIIVPTKNRYYTLKFLAEYFYQIPSQQIELVIQDNSEKGSEQVDFMQFLKALSDNRIRYFYSNENLSVIENSDLAVLNARGEYISFIGDDDIFSKYIIEFAAYLKKQSIDAALPVKASYSWPDVHYRVYKNRMQGQLTETKVSGKTETVNIESVLRKVLKTGGTEIFNLPRLYHGIVKHDILRKVYAKSGSFFPGPSPDMANAIALCKFVKTYIIVDLPYIVSGHSSSSTGGQGAAGRHIGEIKDIKHLPGNTAEIWTFGVPFYWSGNTIYAESVLQSVRRMTMENELVSFNYNYLYATCLVYDRGYKHKITGTIKQSKGRISDISYLKIYYYCCAIWTKRIVFHLKNNILPLLKKFLKLKNDRIFQQDTIADVAYLNDALIEQYLKRV